METEKKKRTGLPSRYRKSAEPKTLDRYLQNEQAAKRKKSQLE